MHACVLLQKMIVLLISCESAFFGLFFQTESDGSCLFFILYRTLVQRFDILWLIDKCSDES